jgi:hypothetical protein
MTFAEFLAAHPESQSVYDALVAAVTSHGPVDVRVTKSQAAFWGRKAFAWAWASDQYLHGRHAPLVLTLSFPCEIVSPRWKEVVQTGKRRFMHHLELGSAEDVDDEVVRLIGLARADAT